MRPVADPKRYEPWTQAEDEILRTGYALGMPSKEIAAELGRSVPAIVQRARAIGLPKNRGAPRPYTAADERCVIEMTAAGKSHRAVAAALGRSESSVKTKVRDLRRGGRLPPANPEPSKDTPMSTEKAAVAALAPRTAKPADNLRIREMLDRVHEGPPSGRYLGGWSDDRVAKDLNLPRKWVEDVRAMLYGDNGEDPAAEALGTGLAEIRAELDALAPDREAAARLVKAIADLETRVQAVERAAEKLRVSMARAS